MKYTSFTRSTTLTKNRLKKIDGLVDELCAKENLTLVQVQLLSAYSSEAKVKRNEFNKNLTKLLDAVPDDYDEDEVATSQDEIAELCILIESKIKVLVPEMDDSSRVDPQGTQQSLPSVRLPKLELQHFNGDPATWVSFINLFDTTIHHNTSLPGTVKFQYLLSILSDEPLNLIKSLNITAANYKVAYNILKERYHSPRRLLSLHLNKILDLPGISCHSTKQMRLFLNMFNEHSQALKALSCDISSDNPLLSALILRKMDNELRKKFENYRSTHNHEENEEHTLPQVKEIISFLNDERVQAEEAGLINFHETKSYSNSSNAAQSWHKHVPKSVTGTSKINSPRNVTLVSTPTQRWKTDMAQHQVYKSQVPQSHPCFACSQTGHKVYECSRYKNKTPQERYQIVKENKRCVCCLGNHHIKECKSQTNCFTCHKRHHTSLHLDISPDNKGNSMPPQNNSHAHTSSQENRLVAVLTQDKTNQGNSTVLLGTTLVSLTSESGNTHVFRALIDSCSMCDFVSERAAQLLGSRRYKSTYAIDGISQSSTRTKGITYLNVATLTGHSIAAQNPMLILDKITSDLPRAELSSEVLEKVKPFLLADPSFHLPGGIDVLLGGAIFPQVFTGESYSLGPNMPYVMGTRFGFVIMGQAPCMPNHFSINDHATTLLATSDSDLHNSLQKFWQQEEPPMCSKQTEEERYCDEHFLKTHSRDQTGRYCVRLPFKAHHPVLGQSQYHAQRRLTSLECKFRTQPEFHKLYTDFMADYKASGHMEKLEQFNMSLPHYFLPHHGVIKESNSSTKLRTVFDASCKTSSDTSLNDILLTGRKLQTNICDILLAFRIHTVVFSCDIRQMYRQIRVHPDDQLFQLILWREDYSQPVSIFKLTTVTYGMNSSPYLAIRTLNQLAEDEGQTLPEASRVLKTQTYVDDIIAGADTEEEAVDLQQQLISLLQLGGFELRKWTSNSPALIQSLPKDYRESPVFLHQQPHFSILGLYWSPNLDSFSFNFAIPTIKLTKRQVLSIISKIYDPCGMISPVTMWAKCLMQLLWTKGLDWDEPLPQELSEKWQIFVKDSNAIKDISIPRPFQFSKLATIELHGFSDASESGFAAVIYFRCNFPDGAVTVRQALSKTRVAPLKKVSLPRLELCAAYLLAQLVHHVLTLLSHTCRISLTRLWCDSTIVLTWLQTPSYRLKTYVANRVAQVQEWVPSHCWSHISSAQNPADCASRGLLPSQLRDHTLWWNGPSWLQLPHSHWPSSKFEPVDITSSEETKSTPLSVLVSTHTEDWELLTKFSSWTKLQNVTAYLLRFIYNSSHSIKRQGHLSVSELKKSMYCIFKLIQTSSFKEDIQRLKRSQPATPRLQRLNPFLDSEGILRVGGRLVNSGLNYDARHTIILPKKHHVVDLYIDYHHRKYLHSGPQLTQSLLSQTVWILSSRNSIRSRIHKCMTCFRNKPRNKTPLMGDLPTPRVSPTRPFLHTGIDFGGPFNAKIHNLRSIRHIKIYICLFICFSTKAVHIETVTDLTTDGFIAAMTRFVSRRGLCSDIYSDCGTNFIGANNLLTKIVKNFFDAQDTQHKIQDFSTCHSINFHFNPPAAPHQGGLWESAIKSTKYYLKRVIGDHVLTLLEFFTLTAQIEAMLNSRPLTPLSSDPTDISALTPGHFLIGAPLAAVPEPNLADVSTQRLKHWQLVQALHQRIWRRWHLEYLHTLQQRSKWTSREENLKIGDLVLVHAPSSPLSWPLARIIALSPGADNVVRVVTLKTQTNTITRPATKVFPLPLE